MAQQQRTVACYAVCTLLNEIFHVEACSYASTVALRFIAEGENVTQYLGI
jgi:hypothetical protein